VRQVGAKKTKTKFEKTEVAPTQQKKMYFSIFLSSALDGGRRYL